MASLTNLPFLPKQLNIKNASYNILTILPKTFFTKLRPSPTIEHAFLHPAPGTIFKNCYSLMHLIATIKLSHSFQNAKLSFFFLVAFHFFSHKRHI